MFFRLFNFFSSSRRQITWEATTYREVYLRYQREYAAIAALERKLAGQVEAEFPHHSLGRLGTTQTLQLIERMREFSPLLELTDDEQDLAALCAAGRDLGRYVELRAELDRKRKGRGYGILSRIALECSDALTSLGPEKAAAILDAIAWHSEPSAHLTGLANTLCNALQDVARAEIERKRATLEFSEISKELDTLFLPRIFLPGQLETLRAKVNYAMCLEETIKELFLHCVTFESELPLFQLKDAVKDVLWSSVDHQAIKRFDGGQQLTEPDWAGSYPAYVLYIISSVERIHSRMLKAEIYSGSRMTERLEFIRRRVRPRQFALIQSAFERRAAKY